MKAVGKYVVVKETESKSSKTQGGLLLSSKQREDIRYRQAKIRSVGSDVKGLKAGNDVYYDRSAGFKIEIKNETWQVIKEHDVVVVL